MNKKLTHYFTAEQIEAAETAFLRPYFQWLYIAFWFGLRPAELDRNIEISQDGIRVYQKAMTLVPREERYKFVPAILPEQKRAIRMLMEGAFKRPPAASLRFIFGQEYSLETTRLGFIVHMLKLDHDIAEVTEWVGNKSLNPVYRIYRDAFPIDWGHGHERQPVAYLGANPEGEQLQAFGG